MIQSTGHGETTVPHYAHPAQVPGGSDDGACLSIPRVFRPAAERDPGYAISAAVPATPVDRAHSAARPRPSLLRRAGPWGPQACRDS